MFDIGRRRFIPSLCVAKTVFSARWGSDFERIAVSHDRVSSWLIKFNLSSIPLTQGSQIWTPQPTLVHYLGYKCVLGCSIVLLKWWNGWDKWIRHWCVWGDFCIWVMKRTAVAHMHSLTAVIGQGQNGQSCVTWLFQPIRVQNLDESIGVLECIYAGLELN